MTPYYQDDLVTLYHGDARDWTGAADALVTDPPYGTGAYAADTDVTPLLCELLARFPVAAVFGWPENLVRLCAAAGRMPDEWIVWWPSNAELKGRFASVPVARDSEHIALFGRLIEARGAPVRRTHEYEGTGNNRSKHHVSPLGKRWGDVWRDASPGLGFGGRARFHPNEKPVDVMTRLVGMIPGATILDPFAGSGTTLVAAKSLGRRAIGVEIDERHCEKAAQRLSQEVLGLSFLPPSAAFAAAKLEPVAE